MENNDLWVALDKLYHVVFGLVLTMLLYFVACRMRRRSIWIPCMLSFCGGVVKEVADEFGYFKSAGASFKDLVAHLVGTLVAALVISCFRFGANPYDHVEKALQMV